MRMKKRLFSIVLYLTLVLICLNAVHAVHVELDSKDIEKKYISKNIKIYLNKTHGSLSVSNYSKQVSSICLIYENIVNDIYKINKDFKNKIWLLSIKKI